MATSKLPLTLLLSFLVFLVVEADRDDLKISSNSSDCGQACAARCALASRQKLCKRACGTCCARCSCVPPGTFGNQKLFCPCYYSMTTHGGRRKCP
ncbi:gibberellin-regulated protein 1-like [Coffea eugenioides]|uniref:gibberellin-regulated protein 1-like n=1 Tax=Coffea eugenioides TaxID=49369 RepID=UPI000F6137C1|nr:gibberellin-regulated protein 1-like [Coffea eugenioides]